MVCHSLDGIQGTVLKAESFLIHQLTGIFESFVSSTNFPASHTTDTL